MRIGGTILSALLVLGACSSEATPREPTNAAPPPTASPTPTAVVPTMPPQAREDSPEGAAAFVKHYIDVFNYAASTGDVDELSRLSSPDCKGCQNYIKLYRDTYAAGGYFKGKEWELSDAVASDEGDGWIVRGRVISPAGRFKSTSGSTEREGQPVRSRVGFRLSLPVPSRMTEIGTDGDTK